MSFPLYALMEANKIAQLPKMLQQILKDKANGEIWFQEKFLDLDEKDRWVCIKDTMNTCLEHGLFQERAFYLVMYRQEIRGEEIDDDVVYLIEDDCEENEVQKATCATQTEPIAIQTEEEPKQEVVIPMMDEEKNRAPRKRQKYMACSEFRCFCCKVNLASDGSYHNHFKSKFHIKGIRKMIDAMRKRVLKGDKLIVKVRNASRDPDLGWEIEDEEEDVKYAFGEVEKYLEKGQLDNPITDIFLSRARRTTLSTGQERITWSAVIIPQTEL